MRCHVDSVCNPVGEGVMENEVSLLGHFSNRFLFLRDVVCCCGESAVARRIWAVG